MSISVEVTLEGSSAIDRKVARLLESLQDHTLINEAISTRGMMVTRDYLYSRNEDEHKTADRLGGKRTGFLERAANQTSHSWSRDTATVTVHSPGIGRVEHDVTITPTEGREFLTLPMKGIAYGRTVSQVEEIIGKRLFRPTKKGAKASGHKTGARHTATFEEEDKMHALGTGSVDGLELYFSLVESVTQKKDRELLPSDEAYKKAAYTGITEWYDFSMADGGFNFI